MLQHQSVNIRQISQNRAEQVGYYRFLGNKNVTVSELVRSVADQCQQQAEGLHVLSISDTSEINLQAHRGRLKPDGLGVVGNNRDVRIAKVHLQRPGNLSAQDYPPSVCLYGVEAKEVNPPAGQEPIHWRLLTTHEVVCIEQALKGIQWYCWRWRIEQLFATLKQAGLNLEATQLESVEAIERLTVLALSIAVRTLQLLEGRDNPALPASIALTDEQQQCLSQLAPSLQGRTQKQQNPYPPTSLAWATWLIARLGGWSGYRSLGIMI